MNSVQVAVAEKIALLAPAVQDQVVEALLTREKTKRADAMVQVIDKLEREEKSFVKLVADGATYDEKGNKVTSYFTKARLDERTKTQKKIDKLTGALNKALEKGDFGDVYNFAKSDPIAEDTTQQAA